MFAKLPAAAALLVLCASPLKAQLTEVPELGLRIAPGFEIQRYADHALAPDVYSMTLDPQGRVVISSRGYIKRLLDTDGDGKADGEEQIAKSKSGAMGMLFLDERTLLTIEGGVFKRYIDSQGDGRFDAEAEVIAKFGGGEHGAHALRVDDRGSVYLIGGNDAKFRGHEIINPEQRDVIEGGALLRFDKELKQATVLAHGFRNPYDFDVDSDGQMFCYDSDCEREFFLPWYSPTRLYQIAIGSHHGWRLEGWRRGWKRPDYYPDSVQPLVNVGRGSPTGVAVNRLCAFPEAYDEGVFYCDWTFGKVFFTYTAGARLDGALGLGKPEAEIFIESTGSNGFAPTDIEFAADGSLFLSMGGRGTSGSVFHIRPKTPRPVREGVARPAYDTAPLENMTGAKLQIARGVSMGRAKSAALELEKGLLGESLAPRMDTIRELMEALGDWNLHKPSLELFTAYELASDEIFADAYLPLLELCRRTPRDLLHSLDDDERREAARLLAMLRDPAPISATRMLAGITGTSSPIEDVHYLICLAALDSPLDKAMATRIAAAILSLDQKNTGRQMRSKQTYGDRINELIGVFAKRAPVYDALLEDPRLITPNHASLAAAFPDELQADLAKRFYAAIKEKPKAGWREDAVALLQALPLSEARALLRTLSADSVLAIACARQLAREPEEVDRALLLSVGELKGLEKLPPRADAENLVPLFRATDQKRALKLIARAAGKELTDMAAAESWLRGAKPEIASALGISDAATKTDWPALFETVEWGGGDVEAGATLFNSRACATCHASANALGPDLAGSAQRLSATDLFTAIALPNDNVPEAYRASIFTMKDGTSHVGRVAFSSADGKIVQTAAGTLRLDDAQIASEKQWSRSLMPEGLLNGLTPKQLADLYAYLKTL